MTIKKEEIQQIKEAIEREYLNAPNNIKIKKFLERLNSIGRGC